MSEEISSKPANQIGLIDLAIWGALLFSAVTGCWYWAFHNPTLIVPTLIAEAVAFKGLRAAIDHWRAESYWYFVGAILFTAAACAWCCYTTFESMSTEAFQRATSSAQQSVRYQEAKRDVDRLSAALNAKRLESAPAGAGPRTLAAWDAGQERAIAELDYALDRANSALNSNVPAPTIDWISLGRGLFIELFKLLGFTLFKPGKSQAPGAMAWIETRKRQFDEIRARFWTSKLTPQSAAFLTQEATPQAANDRVPQALSRKEKKRRGLDLLDQHLLGQLSVNEIAAELGVHRSTVYDWRKELKAFRSRPGPYLVHDLVAAARARAAPIELVILTTPEAA
jgi:transposase-like protein